MTMPAERTRALRWSGELLNELLRNPDLDESTRRKVSAVLRHYPTSADIARMAKRGPIDQIMPWLEPEDDPTL